MKLSKVNNDKLSDEEISNIVFSDIDENNLICDVAIVFGNSDMIKERTLKAVEKYKEGRVQKVIFTGGRDGITAKKEETVSEAKKMSMLANILGMPSRDIILEENAKNTFENVEYSIEKLKENDMYDNINNIMIITSDFHLKRCHAICKLYMKDKNYSLVQVKNGYSDKENWFNSEEGWGTGRGIVTFEANILIKYAKEGKIFDLDVEEI